MDNGSHLRIVEPPLNCVCSQIYPAPRWKHLIGTHLSVHSEPHKKNKSIVHFIIELLTKLFGGEITSNIIKNNYQQYILTTNCIFEIYVYSESVKLGTKYLPLKKINQPRFPRYINRTLDVV